MRYARIEENAMDSPKFIAIGDRAWRLWCEGTVYCQRQLSDGLIPVKALRGFRYYSKAAMRELLAVNVPERGPLWHVEGDFVRVHDYLDWNDERQKVLASRKAGKERLDRWKEKRDEKRGVTRQFETQNETRFTPPRDTHAKQNGTEQNNPPEKPPEGSVTPARASRGVGSGVMAGALPRDHVRHAHCGRKCVPEFLHAEFVAGVGGADPDATVRQFYRDVLDSIPDDQPIGDDPVRFWRLQFAARFGTATGTSRTAGNRAAAAAFVGTGER